MKNVALWTLVALNVVLLAAFTTRMTKNNTANAAQTAGGRPGDYLMIPGTVLGGVNDVVYVVDQTNHLLSFMSYDDSSKTVMTSKPRDLDRDFDAPPTRR